MSTLDLVTLPAIASTDLATVTGGYDFTHAVQAGNAAVGPGREAGQALGAGFDAGYKIATGRDSTIGSTAGGPLGGAAGWVGGFATDTFNQLRHPAPATR